MSPQDPYLPPGVTDADIDRAAGSDDPPEDPCPFCGREGCPGGCVADPGESEDEDEESEEDEEDIDFTEDINFCERYRLL